MFTDKIPFCKTDIVQIEEFACSSFLLCDTILEKKNNVFLHQNILLGHELILVLLHVQILQYQILRHKTKFTNSNRSFGRLVTSCFTTSWIMQCYAWFWLVWRTVTLPV